MIVANVTSLLFVPHVAACAPLWRRRCMGRRISAYWRTVTFVYTEPSASENPCQKLPNTIVCLACSRTRCVLLLLGAVLPSLEPSVIDTCLPIDWLRSDREVAYGSMVRYVALIVLRRSSVSLPSLHLYLVLKGMFKCRHCRNRLLWIGAVT